MMTDNEFFSKIQNQQTTAYTGDSNVASCVLHSTMKEWEPYHGECPDCHSNDIEYNTTRILTSNPPKLQLRCKHCGKYFYSSGGLSSWTNKDILDDMITPKISDPLPGQAPYIGDFPSSPYLGGNQGWICPKCGRVMAPHMDYCIFCSKPSVTTISTGANDRSNLKKILEDSSITVNPYDPFFYETKLTKDDQSQFNYITTTSSELNGTNKIVCAKSTTTTTGINEEIKQKFLNESDSVIEAVDKYIEWEKEQSK